MDWWTVTIPTRRTVGTHEVSGTQTWILETESRSAAECEALTHAATAEALRHRRGAAIVPGAVTCSKRSNSDALGRHL